MLVNGGRLGWARVVAGGGLALGVLGLLGTAACGSRTSMLDVDAYGSSEGGSSSTSPLGNAGKSSSQGGGRPVAGRGGGPATAPTAGSGNSGSSSGVDPNVAVAVCQQYCPGYGSQCRSRLKGQECFSTCQAELNNSGAICQALGVQALSCLTPFFSPGSGDCDGAVNRALARCGTTVAQFEECKKNFARAPSQPPLNFVSSCLRSGGPMSDGSCSQIFSCNNGPYITFCNPTGQGSGLLDCTCVTPSGLAPNTHLPASADPCLAATALCQ